MVNDDGDRPVQEVVPGVAEPAKQQPRKRAVRKAKPAKPQGRKALVAAAVTGAIALVDLWMSMRLGIRLF